MTDEEHYFSADPAVPFERIPVEASVWGRELRLTSGSGVFAKGRLDVGTAVLLRETEPPAAGRILDLGCGYGVIGLACALASPEVTAAKAARAVPMPAVFRKARRPASRSIVGVVTAIRPLLSDMNSNLLGASVRWRRPTCHR